jgi:hypothetical protein
MLPRRSPTAPMKCDERRDARTVERFRAGSRRSTRFGRISLDRGKPASSLTSAVVAKTAFRMMKRGKLNEN